MQPLKPQAMEPFTILISFVASSLIIYTCWAVLTAKTAKNLPPGPPKLPLIGNIHLLDKQRPHRKLAYLARKYGPIMHLQVGQVSTVVISSPQLAREILKTQDIKFADRSLTPTADIFFYKGSNIAWSPYGNYWRQLKKFAILELLSAKKVKSFFYIRVDEVTRAFKCLESSSGAPVNFREVTVEIVNNIVSRTTLGDVCEDRKRLLDSVHFMLKTFNNFNLANYYPRLSILNVISGSKAQWLKMHKEIDAILEKILEEHTRSKQDGEHIVDILLRAKDTATNHFDLPLTNDRIKAILLEMLTAATSSSSMTIEWAFCEMMRNPETMRKAQSELRAVVKGDRVTEADIQNLNYTRLVVKETMRLHCVPILLHRLNTEDCVVNGYNIPARTRVLVNAWACATDPEFWENPHSFIPERFENSSIGYSGSDFEFLPFGAGRRMCPGINFGLATVEYVIASLLHRFNWKLPEGVKPHDLDMREIIGISTLPATPLHIVPISI